MNQPSPTATPPLPAPGDTAPAMLAWLAAWAARGWLRPLDSAFAEFLANEARPASPGNPLLLLAAALTSHQLGRGHACLDLAAALADPGQCLSLPPLAAAAPATDLATTPDSPPLIHPAALLATLTLDAWLAALDDPRLVNTGASTAAHANPLTRVGQRLYLQRYWQYEAAVSQAINARLAIASITDAAGDAAHNAAHNNAAHIRQALAALFPSPEQEAAAPDWQKMACALATRQRFAIITGGPGTGKTTTVVRLLALLQTLALSADPPAALSIRLAAPTGKAAARLSTAIAAKVAELDLGGDGAAIRQAIPQQVSTLHRLLGSQPDARRFRHHAGNPLLIDVLVIDEASMVDLEMMAAVLDALPASARLILLGDKDQLASVEAGAVLGQLCQRAQAGHFTPATAGWLQQVGGARIDPALIDPQGTPLDQAVVMLRHSFRFNARSGIGQLAAAINAGAPDAVQHVLAAGHADLQILDLSAPASSDAAFTRLLCDGQTTPAREAAQETTQETPQNSAQDFFGYRHYLQQLHATRPPAQAGLAAYAQWAEQLLLAHGRFQLLCALRDGPWGVAGLNQRIAGVLHQQGLIAATEGWYLGRPVLVTRNDYRLGLMNGDIGLTLALPAHLATPGRPGEAPHALRVAFLNETGGERSIRWVLPSRLCAVETVYAMTVHKAQGSEFDHTVLVLPDQANPILTRELIYTGITRAKSRFTLVGIAAPRQLAEAVRRRVLRASGLMANGTR